MRSRASWIGSLLVFAFLGAFPVAAQTPLGPPLLVSPEPFCNPLEPDLAPLPGGGAVVVWQEPNLIDQTLFARLLDEDGVPAGPPIEAAMGLGLQEPEVAASDDHLAVAFFAGATGQPRVVVRDRPGLTVTADVLLAPAGQNLRPVELATGGDGFLAINAAARQVQAVVFEPDGTVLFDRSLHLPPDSPDIFQEATGVVDAFGQAFVGTREVSAISAEGDAPYVLQRFSPAELPVVDPVRELPGARWLDLAALPGGGLAAVWQDARGIVLEVMDSELEPTAGFLLDGPLSFAAFPHLAVSAEGEIAVAWSRQRQPAPGIPGEAAPFESVLQTVDTLLGPIGSPVVIPQGGDLQTETDGVPQVAYSRTGRVVVAWERASAFMPDPPPSCSAGRGIFAQTFATRCTADAQTLCLQNDRFAVEVAWEDPRSGDTGVGTAQPVTGDTGTFWFFNDDNLELMVKVLDGRLINGHWWVFYGSLTDVEFVMTVRDVVTGEERQFTNPPFTMASEGNVTAFAEEP